MYEHREEGRSEAAGYSAKQATPTAEGAIGEDNDGLWRPRSSRGLTASTSGGCLWLTTWTVCGQSLRDPSFRHLDTVPAFVAQTDGQANLLKVIQRFVLQESDAL